MLLLPNSLHYAHHRRDDLEGGSENDYFKLNAILIISYTVITKIISIMLKSLQLA